MPNVYMEPRLEGRAIEGFVIEDQADHVLATFPTQHDAIDWANGNDFTPLVARVRHLNDTKSPISGVTPDAVDLRSRGAGDPGATGCRE